MELIDKAKAQGRKTLTEAEAKQVLKRYGVPVVEEKTAATFADAHKMAEQIGYPVVLKGLGAHLTHKTEKGLVKLNLVNADEINKAALAIEKSRKRFEGFFSSAYVVRPQRICCRAFS